MILRGENRSTRSACPCATLSATNPIRTGLESDGSVKKGFNLLMLLFQHRP